ncbi:filamentous hemagglutinin N-terminal domain-containing protein [Paraburkholderia caffeinitolerans]|uniref:two-partner secretion domain-containing protein n=1 Tax=Paraburkholderia caffeinitolerans TaxID=1723730 RepID=UPI0015843933|nr:filamentous hemagglutinin N-terminal domain-containing protein [Paraburkholderia caffeinitolerans]
MRPLQAKAIASVVAALFEATWATSLLANPTGAQVVAGGVTVSSPSASQMNITQSTPNAIVNWNTFSIGAGEAVNIAQPSVSSALLNRVVGNNPSDIAGRLSANGRVFLVNPAGVIFAPGSSVNVGSLVASTLGISNADFLAGNFHFIGKAPGAVVNAGSITAADGGTIALLGGTVSNTGVVAAKLGTVALGAGSDVTLDFAGDGLTTLKINAGTAGALIGNAGTLAADGGTVVMSAQTADALAGTVINQQGIVRAQSLAARDGHIVLDGGTSGETYVSGTLDASGGAGLTGGQIDVTGYDVGLLAGANLNASGAAGGGSVRVGGGAAGADPTIRNADAVWMDPNAQIHADALTNGNGGHIVAYGTTAARLYGTLSANGGAQGGNGGYVETSAHYLDTNGATVQALAPKGTGGMWELDPFEIDIVAQPTGTILSPTGTPPSVMFGPASSTSVVMFTAIQDELNAGTSVTVSTVNSPVSANGLGNINVQAPIVMTGASPATLTLSASGSITVTNNITSTGGPLGIVLDANVGNSTSAGVITVRGGPEAPVQLFSNGGDITIGTQAGLPATFDGAAVLLSYANIDARVGQSAANSSGSVTIHGQAPAAVALSGQSHLDAVGIYSSSIATSTGDIEIEGTQGSGTTTPVGGVYISSAIQPEPSILPTGGSTVTTGSGSVRIYGIGADSLGNEPYQVSGVAIDDASTIQTNGGSIDIRGQVTGARTDQSTTTNLDQGVLIATGATLYAQGAGGTIAITGSSNSASPGVTVSSYLDGQLTAVPSIQTGTNGIVTIRAANDGSTSGLYFYGTPNVSSPGGTLILLPGVVNADFSIGNSDATPIALGDGAAAFGINTYAMAMLSSFANVVIGSATQTGSISVAPETSVSTNLTLENNGSGSKGIDLSGGIFMPENTLTLISAGPVTQGGAIQAVTVVLGGPGTFTLNNTGNAVGTLSLYGTGNVNFVDSQTLTLAATGANSYDAASGTFTSLGSISAISIAGDLVVTTGEGDINVNTPIVSTASGATTLSLNAEGYVNVDASTNPSGNATIGAASGAGPLNVTLDAQAYGEPGSTGVTIANTTFNTNGGTFTIGDTASSAVSITNSTIATQGGAVSITGTSGFGDGVALGYSTIAAAGGGVSISGTSLYDGNGITLNQSSIGTTNGAVTLSGSGDATLASSAATYSGISISGAGSGGVSAINVTGSGAVTLTGRMGFNFGSGIKLTNASIAANGGAIKLSSTDSTSSASTGIELDSSIISNTSGAVTLTGNSISNGASNGVVLNYSLIATGTGNATINGTTSGLGPGVYLFDSGVHTAGGAISVAGASSSSGSGANYGVQVQGDYVSGQGGSAGGAAFSATGSGAIGISGTASNSAGTAYGVSINTATLDAQAGGIQVSGTVPLGTAQSATAAPAYATGVVLAGTTMQTTTGTIGVTGTATGNYTAYGVQMTGGALSTSGGNISFNGTAQSSSQAFTFGVLLQGQNSEVSAGTSNAVLSAGGSGAIGITGTASGYYGYGVEISQSNLATLAGPLTVSGTANVNSSGTGVVLSNTLINGAAGNVQISGTTNDAPGQSHTDGFGISAYGSSIQTTSGSVTLSGAATGATDYAYGTFLSGGYLATGSTTAQPAIQTGSGAITVNGSVPATTYGSVGIDLVGAGIASTSGTITLTGLTTGTPTTGLSSTGVVLGAANSDSSSVGLVSVSSAPGTTLTTGSGTLAIRGSGSGNGVQGVLVADGSQIVSNNGGTIDIRGVATSPTTSASGGNIQYDYGTLVYSGTIAATQPNTVISIAGSTNTSDAGLAFGAVAVPASFNYASGPVQVNAGPNGTVALRSANDGTTTSLADSGAPITSSGGTLAILPASVNPTTFAFIASDSTPITLFGTGAAGLSIDAGLYSMFSGFSALALGSSTQTGLITVSGVCPSQGACTSLVKPTLNQSLTLMNTGSGSHGIQLLYGISLGNNTLTLASAGAVTDPGGIQAAGLLLQGPGNFTLNDPENDVGVLAMLNAGNVNFLNSTSFVIGPIVSRSFDAASNTATTIDATNSSLTGNLLAQAATGGVGLGGGTASANGPTGGKNTNLSAGGTIDLVMENGVFTNNGTGNVSATNNWRIWASTWMGETRGNVQPNTSQPNFYGCAYGAGCSWGGVVPLTGDHFVYIARPTVIVTANGATKLVGAPNPNFGFTTSGLINGDTTATLNGTFSTSATTNSPTGQYPIDPAFFSSVGYIVQNAPGTLTVSLPPPPPAPPSTAPRYAQDLPLAVSAMQSFFGMSEKTFVYENNLQGTNICVGSNQPLFTTTPPGSDQDLLAVEWKRVRSQPNLNSCMLLNGQHGCGDF